MDGKDMRIAHSASSGRYAHRALLLRSTPFIVLGMDDERAPSQLQLGLGAAVRRFRESNLWTQADLGERIGVEQGSISRIEKGRIWPESEKLEALARAFGVPLHLLFEEAEKTTGESLSREAMRVARKWQNAPPHQREALSTILGLMPQSSPTPDDRTGTEG